MRRLHFIVAQGIFIALLFGTTILLQSSNHTPDTVVAFVLVCLFTPSLVRRIHDVGHSGWLSVLALGFPLFSLLLLVLPGVSGPNKYGDDPKKACSANI